MAFDVRVWNALHFQNTEQYAAQVERLYREIVAEIARVSAALGKDAPMPFTFSQYPSVQTLVDSEIARLAGDLTALVESGQTTAWNYANRKNDAFVREILGDAVPEKYNQRNVEALRAFQQRRTGGLTISQRVFKRTRQFKEELETGLAIGMASGESAQKLAARMNKYLVNPDLMGIDASLLKFESYRKSLLKRVNKQKPGTGVYRSSYKNALRLTRHEINTSYRESDYARLQQLDFVVGYEVKLSNKGNSCPVCIALAGKYPKSFKFTGNHVQCMCYMVSILATAEERREINRRILSGEPTDDLPSQNAVTDLPQNYTDWVSNNTERIEKGKSAPIFVQNNYKGGTLSGGLKPGVISDATPTSAGFMMNSDSRKVLSARGLTIIGDSANYQKVMGGFDLTTLDDQLNAIAKEKAFGWKTKNITIYDKDVFLSYQGEFKGEDIKLVRRFLLNGTDRTVEHNLFTLPKSLQGGGMSRQVFKSLYEQYRAAGIGRIEVHANIDVGGLAWARYGFRKNKPDFTSFTKPLQKKLRGKDLAAFKEFHAKHYANPDYLNMLSEKDFGKKMLLGKDVSWYGHVDLNDPVNRQLFEDYLFSR